VEQVDVERTTAGARAWLMPTSAAMEELLRLVLNVFVGTTLLAVSMPLLLVVVAAIRMESPGSALFRQVRLGKNRRPFVIYKLRSMYVDAPERWPGMYDYELDSSDFDDYRFHPHVDPRVTRVGRFLRRPSLDELPNLLNVVKGDMNLVGPRPEIPEMERYYTDHAARIFDVKPGVTSLAKVRGRDELTMGETIALELHYIDRRSLLLDLKILVATAVVVITQRGVLAG
jgi:lipopolysaccharide/colanic/teichoic acid biosynthesis glycosyltransferase